jgi:hypothetical protein
MSVRTELEELVKWISELSAKEKPTPSPEPLPREVWQAVDSDLRRASEKFGEARVALPDKGSNSFLAEVAGDLERQAEALALRAHLLSRRAPPKPKPEPGKLKTVAQASEAAATAVRAKLHGAGTGQGEGDDPSQQPPQPPAPARSPADLVKSAGDTVETAHEKLEVVKAPDAVLQAFEEELDVLAEMTLSLRQKCERLDDVATVADAKARDPHGEPVRPEEVR